MLFKPRRFFFFRKFRIKISDNFHEIWICYEKVIKSNSYREGVRFIKKKKNIRVKKQIYKEYIIAFSETHQ